MNDMTDGDDVTRMGGLGGKGLSKRAKSSPMRASDLLSEREAKVEHMHIHMRRDVSSIARDLGTTSRDVLRVLNRIRLKYAKQGELMLATPNAEHAQETRTRYDSLIRVLRDDLERIPADMWGIRVKLAKTVAEVERMRDDALLAFGIGDSTQTTAGFVYVSHLREGGENARSTPPLVDPNAKRVLEGEVVEMPNAQANAQVPLSGPHPAPGGERNFPSLSPDSTPK